MEGVSGKTVAREPNVFQHCCWVGQGSRQIVRRLAGGCLGIRGRFLDLAYQYAIDPSLVCRTDAMFLGLKSSQSVLNEGVCNVRYD